MEAVLGNVERTAELLVVSRGPEVQRWDRQTVRRAFQWTRYCEHIYCRFHTNSSIRDAVETRLRDANRRLRAVFGQQHDTGITFSDLSRCQHLLLTRLLENTALPRSLLEILLTPPGPLDTDGGEGGYSRLIEHTSACHVLHLARSTPRLGPDAEVLGALLMERLDALLGTGRKVGGAATLLDSMLQTREGHVCSVIAAALLTRKHTSEDVSGVFLLDWLQHNDRLLQDMCSSLPLGLLTDLAQQNVKFMVAYCNILKKWALDMEFDLNEGEWVKISTASITMSYQLLAKHFLSLFEACPSLREDTVEELNVLKISDGDFDERGLSVWGDLLTDLSELRKCS